MEIDLRPLIDKILVPIVLPLLSSLGVWGLWKLIALTGLKIDDTQRAVVQSGLQYAINYASTKIASSTPDKIPVNVKSAVVAEAAQYALAHIPDALAHFAIDPAKLATMIEARLAPAPASAA